MGSLLIGIGMGLARTVFIVGIQNSVDWKMRGVATASNMFMNILGNTMGAALLGGVLNIKLVNYLKGGTGEHLDVINLLLDPTKRSAFPQGELKLLTDGLALSLLSSVFF
ncbi:hypothetical protein [Desulfosporosinus sp. SB140]|uniref:hypothetical protein n=1 Tax=Desulfosporosinus paludis TaxID=3115649 RepID=UPI00388E4155